MDGSQLLKMIKTTCEIPNCNKIAQNINTALNPKPRKSKWVAEEFGGDGYVCGTHHQKKYLIGDWIYKIHRKKYCENIDGRLGFKCTTTIIDPEWQLDTDHINGDPSDNREENLQTFCKCCHAIKTRDSKDYASPGRKSLNLLVA